MQKSINKIALGFAAAAIVVGSESCTRIAQPEQPTIESTKSFYDIALLYSTRIALLPESKIGSLTKKEAIWQEGRYSSRISELLSGELIKTDSLTEKDVFAVDDIIDMEKARQSAISEFRSTCEIKDPACRTIFSNHLSQLKNFRNTIQEVIKPKLPSTASTIK